MDTIRVAMKPIRLVLLLLLVLSVRSRATENEQHQESADCTNADSSVSTAKQVEVVIIGAGPAGLAAAYTLSHHGVTDFLILEASSNLGGRVQKDTAFTKGLFPIDVGASFIQYPVDIYRIVAPDGIDMVYLPNELYEYPHFLNYTYHDFWNEYIAPKNASKIIYGCRVVAVDYSETLNIETVCENGKTFLSEQVIVTVPLPVLMEHDILFEPSLPSDLFRHHSGWMWGGFKIFLEFTANFSIIRTFCFPDIPGANGECLNEEGESMFWDETAKHFPDMRDGKNPHARNRIIGGYVLGKPSAQFLELNDDDAIARRVLELMDEQFDNQASANIVRYKVQNWSKNPNVRGAVSSAGFDFEGAQNVRYHVWIAGEAFPTGDVHNSWVDSGAFSGDDAAKQILQFHHGILDDEWFWHKVARDLGR